MCQKILPQTTLKRQNPDLNLEKGSMVPKFIYVTKGKHRNAVVEVGPEVLAPLLAIIMLAHLSAIYQ
jgi:hypothetical protein